MNLSFLWQMKRGWDLLKNNMSIEKEFKKYKSEAKRLRIFHEKVLHIRIVIESCVGLDQIDNTKEWIDKVLTSDVVNNYRESAIKEWLFFLCEIQKEKLAKEDVILVKKKK